MWIPFAGTLPEISAHYGVPRARVDLRRQRQLLRDDVVGRRRTRDRRPRQSPSERRIRLVKWQLKYQNDILNTKINDNLTTKFTAKWPLNYLIQGSVDTFFLCSFFQCSSWTATCTKLWATRPSSSTPRRWSCLYSGASLKGEEGLSQKNGKVLF